MAKNLKLNIKNTQIAQAVNLGNLKNKLASKKEEDEKQKSASAKTAPIKAQPKEEVEPKEEAPRIKARSRSAFAEGAVSTSEIIPDVPKVEEPVVEPEKESEFEPRKKTSQELRKEIFGEPEEEIPVITPPPLPEKEPLVPKVEEKKVAPPEPKEPLTPPPPVEHRAPAHVQRSAPFHRPPHRDGPSVKLGPTGKHISDFLPNKYPPKNRKDQPREGQGGSGNRPPHHAPRQQPTPPPTTEEQKQKDKLKAKVKGKEREGEPAPTTEDAEKKGPKAAKFKEFRDIKPAKRTEATRAFDARDRHGLRDSEDDQNQWRKKRHKQMRDIHEDTTIRPTQLKVRIPISIKDLASEMKLKASQLIAKLFMQGLTVTLNDLLEDETTIQLLGHEFGCEITIDTTEEERIRITDASIKQEIKKADPEKLKIRPPVVAFMGHVDHGKTSLIDAIRKSNRAAGEAGAITQHIGAFRCSTAVGDITILDTPGHEAFSSMRARGADVTDIVVLVVAGDEGMRQQTIEALQHAKAANVTIVVAINKSDKPNFNVENVYRQLAENELLPEAWGGQTITVNCSAVTGDGVSQLLEMLALQAEVLELNADPTARARGTVLESEMHKGMGAVATVLVQNGTLKKGDAVVFGQYWGRIKTMHDENKREMNEAGPSTPIEITGLSGLPEAGQEFIVVVNEKEARDISEARALGMKQVNLLQAKKLSMENLFQQAADSNKKILNIVLRADVQGSLEALRSALMKIQSAKAELNIIFAGVGEISESDVQLAAASKAVIIGFHTKIESHADALVKELGIQVRLHDIIYHAVDDTRGILGGLLDKIVQETDKGKVEVKAIFKSSQYGMIAGCQVTEGSVHRNHSIRVKRNNETVWTGTISSLKRVKEDVREVAKGLECGIVLNNFQDVQVGDILEAYEISYISQEL